jgi:tRNA A-37 threonylcarbamoyl transferase component Bud32
MVGWSVPGVVHLRQVREDPVGRRVLARHRVTRKPLTITYLAPEFLADSEFRTRFRDEFARLAQVRDVRVARAHRYVEDDHGAAVISEHITGTSLRALLLAQGAVSTAAALVVLKDALLALIACHKAGLAHGDIKPEGMILTHTGRIRLVDFGLWTAQSRQLLARSTPFYLAPEQWNGPSVGPAGDIYAATVTFFECLLGAPPFYADGVAELSAKHQDGVAPVEAAPEPVRGLVERGLTKDPRNRPEARDLLALVDDVAAQAVRPGWERRGRRELAALLASRSALPDVPVPSWHSRAGAGYGKPVRLAAVIGGALALAAGLSSPPLAVLPGISIFGSGGRPPVLAFPEPDRGTVAVRAATNGPLADRAATGTGGRPLVRSLPAPNTQAAPYEGAGPGARHPGAAYPDGVSTDRPAPGHVTSATPACTQSLVDDHKPCTAVKPVPPGSAGSTTDPSEVSIPVSLPVQLPVPVPVPAAVEIPVELPVQVPVQLPAPVRPPAQVPQSIPRSDQAVPGRDNRFSKDFRAQPDRQGSRTMTRPERSETTRDSGRQQESHHQGGFGNSSGARNSGNR